jgi:hypothetical protein
MKLVPSRPVATDVLTEDERALIADAPVLDPPSLDAAIIGVLFNGDGEARLAYSYYRLVERVADELEAEEDAQGNLADSLGLDDFEFTPEHGAEETVDHHAAELVRAGGPRAPVVLMEEDGYLGDPSEFSDFERLEFKGETMYRVGPLPGDMRRGEDV